MQRKRAAREAQKVTAQMTRVVAILTVLQARLAAMHKGLVAKKGKEK